MAYRWRQARSLDTTALGSRDDGADYTAAVAQLSQRVAARAAIMSAEDATAGGIEAWLADYATSKAPTFEDGTVITSIDWKRVSCSDRGHTAIETKQRLTADDFRPRRAFARTIQRPEPKSDADILTFDITQEDIALSNGRVVRVLNLAGRYQVIDPVRFETSFGEGARGLRLAEARLAHIVVRALHDELDRRTPAQLADFDPFLVVGGGEAALAKTLERIGVAIVDLGGDDAGYRLEHAQD